ncbi:MAG TPA: hypothetical protein VKE40_26340 [Gemmataceae bacterium]|nr:hypothetical protein [Gemmataceae bacterium]
MGPNQPDAAVPEPVLDDFQDLMEAAQSALGFWDDPDDDKDWNASPAQRNRSGKMADADEGDTRSHRA